MQQRESSWALSLLDTPINDWGSDVFGLKLELMLQSYIILLLKLLHKDWIQRLQNQDHHSSLCVQCLRFRIQSYNFHWNVLSWVCDCLECSRTLITWPKSQDSLQWLYTELSSKGSVQSSHARPLYAASMPLYTAHMQSPWCCTMCTLPTHSSTQLHHARLKSCHCCWAAAILLYLRGESEY